MVKQSPAPHERPPEEREETHRLEQRRADGRTALRNDAARIAMRYATAVTVAIDPERGELPSDSGFERVCGDRLAWSDEPFATEAYRISLPDGRAAVESLLDAGSPLWDFAVHTDEEWLYRRRGSVNVAAAETGYGRDLRDLADERGAILVPTATLGHWTDGQQWYEVTEGHLCIYPEEITGKSWEERQRFTTHGEFSVVAIERLHVSEETMTIELSWASVEDESRFMQAVRTVIGTIGAILPIPDAPTEMVFDSRGEFETAVDALLQAVGESYGT